MNARSNGRPSVGANGSARLKYSSLDVRKSRTSQDLCGDVEGRVDGDRTSSRVRDLYRFGYRSQGRSPDEASRAPDQEMRDSASRHGSGHSRDREPLGCGHDTGIDAAQTEVERELPIPAWGFGVLAFLLLLGLLLITLSIGKGRPHS